MSATKDLVRVLARLSVDRIERVLAQDRDTIHSMTDDAVLKTLRQADAENRRCSEAAEALYLSSSKAAIVMLLATEEAAKRGLKIP